MIHPPILDDTIVGVATPPGYGGISILKLSGPLSLSILERTFRSSPKGSAPAIRRGVGRRMLYGFIVRPEANEVIDEVLVSVMEAPSTYTREDVVEINLHGGPVVTEAALGLMIACGARPAEPGEFTRRAVLNGRIDLTQAEAVADLIHAKTGRGARAFARLAGGAMGRSVGELETRLTGILADIEADIEFPEDGVETVSDLELAARILDTLERPVRDMLRDCREGRILRSGLRVTLIGRPNAGKSTLMNRLLGRDRAIVTPLPGTTRDVLEEAINIGGIPVVLVDTAGIHESDDPIERIGVQRGREAKESADLVIAMVDGLAPEPPLPVAELQAMDKDTTLLAVNKIDRLGPGQRPELPWNPGLEVIDISAKHGHGLDALQRWIGTRGPGVGEEKGAPERLLPNERQRWHLSAARESLARAVSVLEDGGPRELAAEDLKGAGRALGRILGRDVDLDVLDQVFARFCIGK
jgi:tRNA modification GTPase